MKLSHIILLIAAFGAAGGLVNCVLSGEFHLPRLDTTTKVWRPGWIGNVLLGGVAAVVIWGIYGPFSSFDVLHGRIEDVHLTLGQLLTSLVIGLSGGKILTVVAEKQAEQIAKDQLKAVVAAITKEES